MLHTSLSAQQDFLNDVSLCVQDVRSDYKVTITGYGGLLSFFGEERDWWTNLLRETTKSGHQAPQLSKLALSYFPACIDSLMSLRGMPNGTDPNHGQERWNDILPLLQPTKLRPPQGGSVFYSRSSLAILLAEAYSESAERGEGAIAYFTGASPVSTETQAFLGFMDAYHYERATAGDVSPLVRLETDSMARARNEWEQTTRDIRSGFERLAGNFAEWRTDSMQQHDKWRTTAENGYHEFIETKRKEIAGLVDSYNEKIKVDQPIKYWRQRSTEYEKRGRWWLGGLGAIVLALMVAVISILDGFPRGFQTKLFSGDAETLRGIILLVIVIAFGVYVCRLFVRMSLNSFRMGRGAEEREQLTMVYLGLVKKGSISEREREIILEALFSRGEKGDMGTESSSAMPDVRAIISQLNRKSP